MIKFVVGLIARLIAVVLGVTTLLFILSRLSGDPAALYSVPEATPEMLELTRQRMGLNDPLFVQYLRALTAPFTLSFPNSYLFQGPVLGEAVSRLSGSAIVVMISLVLSSLFAGIVGLIGSLYPSRLAGRIALMTSYITQAVPYFWFTLILVLVLAIKLGVLPATGNQGWRSFVIPIATLSVMGYSTMSRLARGQLLDAYGESFILTARSKGVAPAKVLFGHAMPAAAPPLLAWLGIEFSFMVSSLLIIEPILNFNGIGSFLISGVNTRDFPVVQVSVVLIATAITLVNGLMDFIVTLIDPRVGKRAT